MPELLKTAPTRFRAYQLDQAGSSFSYFDGKHFTLIEGMATDLSKSMVLTEMQTLWQGLDRHPSHHQLRR